ncbi:hypothetical protein [Nocardiopsis sp. LOL_012]|uniref:hypothetical protein n=1 Tax=Nocardiopsis sp. LOL_012 TaxID=3345409 RepID=UPI003A8ABD7F
MTDDRDRGGRTWWSPRTWRKQWRRFLRWLGAWAADQPADQQETTRLPEPGPLISKPFVVPSEKLRTFRTPAKGDGFTFEVQANVVWRGHVTDDSERNVQESRERVEKAVEERQKSIRRELITLIRPIARTFAPFQAAELEDHLYTVVPELLATRMRVAKPTNTDSTAGRVDEHRSRNIHVPSDDGYEMEVFLWVDSCPEIRRLQQQIWASATIAAGKGVVERQSLETRTSLQRAWRDVLTALLVSMGVDDPNQARWTELLALQLAHSEEPEETARIIVQQIMQRHAQAKKLHEELAEYLWAADGADGRVRTMDFALGADTALDRLMKTLGVPDLADTRSEGLSGNGTDR